MTDAEWLACAEPQRMLNYITGRSAPWVATARERFGDRPLTALQRKLRLFACACVRQVWYLLTDERSRRAVEVAERFADDPAGLEDLRAATERESYAAYCRFCPAFPSNMETLPNGKAVNAFAAAVNCVWSDDQSRAVVAETQQAGLSPTAQADLLRCIFGNPWRPGYRWTDQAESWTSNLSGSGVGPMYTYLPRAWLAWNGGTVRSLAEAAYESRDFSMLAVIADCLEEAGCQAVAVLEHLRGPGPHAKGCYVIDLLLGKS